MTSLGKVGAPAVGAAGLAGAVTSFVASLNNWGSSTMADWVLLVCATVLLAVTLLSVAMILKADLAARAQATAAQYQARAEAASALLRMIKPGERT